MIVAETKEIISRLSDHWAHAAEVRAHKYGEVRPYKPFNV